MTSRPTVWYPIAVALTVINLAGVGMTTQPWHAAVHAVLALAFGLWAQRLQRGGGAGESEAPPRLDALEAELGRLRAELSETQERLDFAERLLAQRPEARRVGPQD
jgi:hypothetical protein